MRPNARQHPPARHSDGIDSDDREQILLDDLRYEVERLADAIERQNELLAEDGDREQSAGGEP